MERNSRILVLGGGGLVGSALVKELQRQGYTRVLFPNRVELDLSRADLVNRYFCSESPEFVFMAAARVGGILGNVHHPVEMLVENLQLTFNAIQASHQVRVKKLIFLGSSCVYPKMAPQPIRESDLMSGFLEPTNQSYALAKICGIQLCDSYHSQFQSDFISAMPCNVYGPNDRYDPVNSHVIPGLIEKFVTAVHRGEKEVTCWGTGRPLREFIFSEDLARALILLMRSPTVDRLVNIGTETEVSISELAHLVAQLSGYRGSIVWDQSKPDGTPRKKLNFDKIKSLGWRPHVDLSEGLQLVIEDFKTRFLN